MELPYGTSPYAAALNGHFEENKIQCPLEDGRNEVSLALKHKRSKKTKPSDHEGKVRSRKMAEPGKEIGHWNPMEKRRYHWFLEIYHSHFENKHMRRMDKIFKTMADFLGSRAADQCRSHHQKMEKKYKNFYNIIFNLRLNHYGSSLTADLAVELRHLNLCLDEGLISEAVLEQQLQDREEQQPATVAPVKSEIMLGLDSPKWTHCHFEKHNIDHPMELFMDLSQE